MDAFVSRWAAWADQLPELIAQVLPVIFMGGPVLVAILGLAFGQDLFQALLSASFTSYVAALLLVSLLAPLLSAGLAGLSLIQERQAGRWDLMLLMPYDRMALLIMRVSTFLFPYRPLLGLFELLQTLGAVLLIFGLTLVQADATAQPIVGTCFFFLGPCLFLMHWERRQDYALGVAIGTLAGLGRSESQALGWTLGGVGLILGGRAMLGILALAYAPLPLSTAGGVAAFAAGLTALPLFSVPWAVVLPLWGGYFLGRELLIRWLWRATQGLLEGRGEI
jgi:hypothetical protein